MIRSSKYTFENKFDRKIVGENQKPKPIVQIIGFAKTENRSETFGFSVSVNRNEIPKHNAFSSSD